MVAECADRFTDSAPEPLSCVPRLRVGYREPADGHMTVSQPKLMELTRILNESSDIERLVGGRRDTDQVLVLDCIVF